MPSNLTRSKSIKERISHYLSQRINGDNDNDHHRRTPVDHSEERTFADFGQVLNAAVEQSRSRSRVPKAGMGFRQRFMAEIYAALDFDGGEPVRRSSTTGRHRRHHRRGSTLRRSATAPHRRRRHHPEHSSSLRESSSLSRGRRHRREDSSAGRHGEHGKHSPSPATRDYASQPPSRARSYRAASFTSKPIISAPLTVVDLYEHPALRNRADSPLTDRKDALEFDIPPTPRAQPKVPQPPSTDQMPSHRRAASNGSRPVATRGRERESALTTTTRWGDFQSEALNPRASQPISDEAVHTTPRPRRSHGRSQSPAKFPSFSPAPHRARAQSPLARPPVARTPSTRHTRGPVMCELCRGLSDPTVSYAEVQRHLCATCARKAFGSESKASSSREPPPRQSRPPTPPVKDFAGFDFAHPNIHPPTPSPTTGSHLQPKFDALTTDARQAPPLPNPGSGSGHHPRPPSSEYSVPVPTAGKGNPYASSMGNPFLSSNPLVRARRAAAAPPLPRLRDRDEEGEDREDREEEGEDGEVQARNRRSSFYRFYDDVLEIYPGSPRDKDRDKGKGKGKERE
ncbi:hypothetical protein MMC07_006037 [Pseudocyphellaria aurata]|nr:hypothetical protein [Pseudocyphellaria aurata]